MLFWDIAHFLQMALVMNPGYLFVANIRNLMATVPIEK